MRISLKCLKNRFNGPSFGGRWEPVWAHGFEPAEGLGARETRDGYVTHLALHRPVRRAACSR
jgi:hypothetical protein